MGKPRNAWRKFISEPISAWVGEKRKRYGEAAVFAVIAGTVLVALNLWEHIDFLSGKRKGIAVVVGWVLDVIFSAAFGYTLFFAGGVALVTLPFFNERRRKRHSRSIPQLTRRDSAERKSLATSSLIAPKRVRLTSETCNTPGTYTKSVRTVGLHSGEHERTFKHRWRFHISQGARGINLECQRFGKPVPESVVCEVEDTHGKRHKGNLERAPDTTVRCTYPVDFGVEPETGIHHVHWTALGKHMGYDRGPFSDEPCEMWETLDFTIEVTPTAPDPSPPIRETETDQVIPWRRVREYNALLREHPASEFNDTSGWLSQIGTTQDAQIDGDKIDMRLVEDGRSVRGAVRCELTTPTGLYIADERQRQIDEGVIKEWQLPDTEREGFVFPSDFRDTKGNRPPTEIAPGIYVATWFGYESYEPFEFHPHFLRKAAFRIAADGQLQEELR